MLIEWGFGQNKYFRKKLSVRERSNILDIKKGSSFVNEGGVKWLSIYFYEDGEYVVCLDQLGEAYYEGSADNGRFKKTMNIRLEEPKHVILFIDKYVMDDKFFLS